MLCRLTNPYSNYREYLNWATSLPKYNDLEVGRRLTSARGLIGSVLSRVSGSLSQFTATLLIGSFLGSEALGAYGFSINNAFIVAAIIGFGFPCHVLSTIAPAWHRGDIRSVRGTLHQSLTLAIYGGVFLIVVAGSATALAVWNGLLTVKWAYMLVGAGGLGVLLSLTLVFSAVLLATDRVATGLWVERGMVPSLVLSVVGLQLVFGHELDYEGVIGSVLFSGLATMLVAGTITIGRCGVTSRHANAVPWKRLAGFWFLGILDIAVQRLPYAMLPLFGTLATIGYFTACMSLALVAGTIVHTMSAYFSPRFARLYSERDRVGVKKAYRWAQITSFGMFLPISAVYFVFGKEILSIFGPTYADYSLLLTILTGGQLVSVCSGVAVSFLSVTGNIRSGISTTLAALAVGGGLMVALGPRIGVTGVAIGHAAAISIRGIVGLELVRRVIARMDSSMRNDFPG